MKTLVIAFLLAGVQSAIAGDRSDDVQLPTAVTMASRTMTPQDILGMRRPVLAQISPDGRQVAFVVRVAVLEENVNRHALYVVRTDDKSTARKIVERDGIRELSWFADSGRLALVAAARDGQTRLEVWSLAEPSMLLNVPQGPALRHVAVAPDGHSIAMVLGRYVPAAEARKIRDTGLVYDWTRHDFIQLAQARYERRTHDALAVLELESLSQREVWSAPPVPAAGSHDSWDQITKIVWSPDALRVAVEYQGAGSGKEICVVPAAGGLCEAVEPDSGGSQTNPLWTADASHLYYSWLEFKSGDRRESLRQYAVADRSRTEVVSRMPTLGGGRAWFALPDRQTLLVADRGALYEWNLSSNSLRTLAEFITQVPLSFDRQRRWAVLAPEDLRTPPGIGVLRIGEQRPKRLVELNPEVSRYRLGEVRKVTVKNPYDYESSAYLVYPVDYRAGQRYPLIVATYGFSGTFVADAEWHNTFPAQTLAARGYCILLLNVPSTVGDTLAGDPARARWASGWNWLATVEAGVRLARDMGVADAGKAGYYGWSKGGFIGQFAAAHTDLFQAYAIGESRDVNPGSWWAGGMKSFRRTFTNLYGGLLDRETLPAYEAFAPSMNVRKMKAPMLHEYAGQRTVALQLFMLQRDAHLPAELVFYDGQDHQFESPRAILASMRRKVDWFDFWLLNKENTEAGSADQYLRWRAMREEWREAR